jgi:hypothetical protein
VVADDRLDAGADLLAQVESSASCLESGSVEDLAGGSVLLEGVIVCL